MMLFILIGISVAAAISLITIVYMSGRKAGKKSEQIKQLETQNEILHEVAKIKASTVNDDIDVVRERLRKRIKTK